MVDAILAGLEGIARDITLTPIDDDFGYVDSIIPTGFTSVPTGESRTFQVSLLSDGTGEDDTLKLVAPGFGETVVNVDVDDVTVPKPSSILYRFAKIVRDLELALIPQPLLPTLGEGEPENNISLRN